MREGTKHLVAVVICGALMIGSLSTAFGRVFWRRRARTPSDILSLSENWSRLLQSRVRINGSGGNLEILGCEGSLESAMRRIQRAGSGEDGQVEFTRGEGMARAMIETATDILRIIAVEGAEPGKTVVFILVQTRDEYVRSLSPPAGHVLDNVPSYPGSVARTYIQLEETRAQLEVSATSDGAGSVHAFFQSAMASSGWRDMMPPAGMPSVSPGLMLFQKGYRICGVLIQPSGITGESIITVLHKRIKQ